jgi:DNA-binding transcriptional MerR regulator
MFGIGEFARFTRASVKMLRHYHDIGLLPAAVVNPATGYRYYTADQIPPLNRILLLRDLGFGLDEIAHLVDAGDTEVHDALDRREAELTGLLGQAAAQLRAVRARRHMLTGATHVTDVLVRPVGPELVATAPAGADVSAAFCRVEVYVGALGARAARPPLMLMPAGDAPEVAVPLSWPVPGGDGVRVRRLPAVATVACTVHRGRYEELPDRLDSVLTWLDATGRRPTGAVRKVYLRFGAEPELDLPPEYLTTDTEDLLTELQVSAA